jgi:fructan beta-fructosidase
MAPLIRCLLAAAVLVCVPALAAAADDILFADFEGDNYGEWKADGAAFGDRPARGTLPGQMPVGGFKGKGLVNSFLGGDRPTGTLQSPEFTIARKYITFLIGGGGYPEKTCMNLLVGDKTVRTAVGPNTVSGGSEMLEPASWDVSEFAGKKARIVIVDDATGGWGHINVDHIVFTDAKPPTMLSKPTRELLAEKRHLHFPVKNGGAKRRVSVSADGRVVREFEIELADAQPDWWAPLDISAWKGQPLIVQADKLPDDSQALAGISQDDARKNSEGDYREPLRPQLHFSPRRGWNNDPNGMVFANGEYHLFFQHNPYGVQWGNMHWGHAVSRDLVHWDELPIALYPPKFGDWAFSGSAVVDHENTSGWKRGAGDLIVAAFTSTGRGECIIYSHDNGRTWVEFEGNPVVKHAGRDPRLLWHKPTRQWVMAVYDEFEKKRWIAFYTSPDLKVWMFRSRIEGFYECPDLFELPLDGKSDNAKWVLTAADSDYMVGTFDGATFTPETPKLKGCAGVGFYAAQTFIDDPKQRVIQIGWHRAPSPGMPFNQSMSIPLELRLVGTSGGPRLSWTPVEKLKSLRRKTHALGPVSVQVADNPLSEIVAELVEIDAAINPGKATAIEFEVRGVPIVYDVAAQEIRVANHRAAAPLLNGRQHLRIFADRTSFEVFASDGLCYVPIPVIPAADNRKLSVASRNGSAKFERLDVHELKSIWGPHGN